MSLQNSPSIEYKPSTITNILEGCFPSFKPFFFTSSNFDFKSFISLCLKILISAFDDFIPIIKDEWFNASLNIKSPFDTNIGIKVEFVVKPIGEVTQSSLCKNSANIFSNCFCSSLIPISFANPFIQLPLFFNVSIIFGVIVSWNPPKPK